MPRIAAEALRTWSTGALRAAGVPDADAAFIAARLVEVDLRGVRSHGTRQLRRYVPEFRDGRINPRPEIRVLRQSDTLIRLDGDGGAGYLAATRAVDEACTRAVDAGIAVAATCHHGHVGSAGIYARQALAHGLLSWCVAGGTGWKRTDKPGATVWDAMAAPPMCFGVPADGGGPPLVLDMNANQFTRGPGPEAAIAAGFPKAVFGSLGMRFVSTLVAGALAGTPEPEIERRWPGATRGFLFVAIDPDAVGDGAGFRAEVRRVIDESLALAPMAGTDAAAVPGTPEWRREREWARDGIPLEPEHVEILAAVAADLELAPPALHPDV